MEKASSFLEEHLREAAASGDIKTVQDFIKIGVDINSQNSTNGWTALHWACKRNYADIVLLLLQNGADKNILTAKGKSAASVCSNTRILQMLGVPVKNTQRFSTEEETDKFIPNYLKNPPINLNLDMQKYATNKQNFVSSVNTNNLAEKDLILKIRIADISDPDFIEIEIPKHALTYENLVLKCCEELNINTEIVRIRKLPNTRLRNDRDVQRLTDFQEIEIVIIDPTEHNKSSVNGTAAPVTPTNNYQSISKKDQTILY